MSATAPAAPFTRTSPPPIKLNRGNIPDALGPNRVQVASFAVGNYVLSVPNDTTLETLLTPSWWANYQAQFAKAGSSVRVWREDFTLVVELMSLGSQVGYVPMMLLSEFRHDNTNVDRVLDEEEPLDLPTGYKVKHSPAAGYYALEPVNGRNITEGRKGLTKRQATAAAIQHNAAANPTPPAAPAA